MENSWMSKIGLGNVITSHRIVSYHISAIFSTFIYLCTCTVKWFANSNTYTHTHTEIVHLKLLSKCWMFQIKLNFFGWTLTLCVCVEKPHAFIMCLTINGFTGSDQDGFCTWLKIIIIMRNKLQYTCIQ